MNDNTGQSPNSDEQAVSNDDITWAKSGSVLRRVKRGSLEPPNQVFIKDGKWINYYTSCFLKFMPKRVKSVPVADVLDVRSGYNTDNLHKASKKYEFQEAAPESSCFSIIFTDARFLHKSVDFAANGKEDRDRWVSALSHIISQAKVEKTNHNEKAWILRKFAEADKNKSGTLSFNEILSLLKKMNLQISEDYARVMFEEAENKSTNNGVLDEEEFMNFFNRLVDRPELKHLLRMASNEGVESLTVSDLQKFLVDEQDFQDVDINKAESILETFEQVSPEKKDRFMGVIGMRRLLQSRWGNIMKQGHESIWQDMNHPLPHYFCNSSHNTYLAGMQLKGEATVEGYIYALKKGARLLELDLFDGDHGEPVITHKRTLIDPITLRNALEAIKRFAFEASPYPVILTLENHVGLVQQKVMVDVFQEVLGDLLYLAPPNSANLPMPSPNMLKRKILLRGKKLGYNIGNVIDEDDSSSKGKGLPAQVSVDPAFSPLISIPSVKLSRNIYADVKTHPKDGSPSLSETSVTELFEGGSPIFSYTAEHFVKSYPKGLRQDSSNMHPVISWICGVQSVALNMQTAGEELDLNTGLFRVNGNCGYVLKPSILLDGIDPRTVRKPKVKLGVGIISAQYLPKSAPGRDIVDPYVSVQIFGVPNDEFKWKTRVVRNNGFNPVWNQSFERDVYCPEIALLRFCVKDFDSTSSNDFIGEFSIPLSSVRKGYSTIRLNTGSMHSPDDSASLFVRIAMDTL